MADVTVKIHGLKQLNRQLNKLKKPQLAVRAATRAGAAVFRSEARANLPQHKKKIDLVRSRRESSYVREVFNIGPLKQHWPLAFLEYGVPPHEIKPKTKKALVDTFGGDLAAASVQHPGVIANHWLSRAFNQGQQKAVAAFMKKLRQRINKEL